MSIALSLAALSLTAAAGTPTLNLTHPGLGTSTTTGGTPIAEHLGLVVGTQHLFVVQHQPAGVAILAASTAAPAMLPAFGGVLAIDPATAFVFAVQPFDSLGVALVPVVVPGLMPVGIDLWSQAASVDVAAGTVVLSNGLTHTVVDLSPVTWAKGDKSQHPLASTGGALVVASQSAWSAFWAQHSGGPSTAPAVDFERDVVVASFAGDVPSSGYALTVDALAPLGGGMRIDQTLLGPGPGCGVFYAVRQPYHFLILDRVFASPAVQVQQQLKLKPPCP